MRNSIKIHYYDNYLFQNLREIEESRVPDKSKFRILFYVIILILSYFFSFLLFYLYISIFFGYLLLNHFIHFEIISLNLMNITYLKLFKEQIVENYETELINFFFIKFDEN